MSADNIAENSQPSRHPNIWHLPASGFGWWAVGLTIAIVPVAWTLVSHAIPWPIFDTAFAPVLLTLLIDAAAVTAALALFRCRDRSVFVLIATIVAFPLALFATLILILEAIFPH